MSPIQKSFLSAGVIVLACGAMIAGNVSRDKADLHLKSISPFASSTGSLFAQTDRRLGGFGGSTIIASLSNVPPDASAADFYEVVSDLLKHYYVDPITDERKLSTGAIRGMVSSLDNTDCLFLDPAEFKAFTNGTNGKFEGIGVELALEMPTMQMLSANVTGSSLTHPTTREDLASPSGDLESTMRVPALVVSAVVPESPAARAGIKVGDSVDSIDGHWVMNPYELEQLRRLQAIVRKDSNQMPKLLELRRDLRKKLNDSMMPMKARDKICMGTSGSMEIAWNRAGTIIPTSVTRSVTLEDAVSKESDGSYAIHFMPGAAAHLKTVLGTGPLTLDLRNNDFGDFDEMRQCLALLAPSGTYGEFANYKGKTAKLLAISAGGHQRDLNLVVDGSTGGVAEMFAMALQSKGYAKLSGPPMSTDRNLVEVVGLPGGSGYTLVTGKFELAAGTAAKRSS